MYVTLAYFGQTPQMQDYQINEANHYSVRIACIKVIQQWLVSGCSYCAQHTHPFINSFVASSVLGVEEQRRMEHLLQCRLAGFPV